MAYGILMVRTGGSFLVYESKKFVKPEVIFRIDADKASDSGMCACEIIKSLLVPGKVGSKSVVRSLKSVYSDLLASEGDARGIAYGAGKGTTVMYRWFLHDLQSFDGSLFDFGKTV